ncbi:MAG: trypsin-like peptidase domain-containing protein [Chloroflexia bacterium]
MKRFLFRAGLILALLLPLLPLFPRPAQADLSTPLRRQVLQSVVQIIAVEQAGRNRVEPKWTGSGTIITPDGLILTNCHVAFPRAMWDDPQFDYDFLIVALTTRSDEPPEPTYRAEVVQYDPNLDLAVIRVTHLLNGTAMDPAKLNLPALTLGDSDLLEIGDDLFIFGYPGIGGETITYTSGKVSGFSREQGISGRAWIKTDATIAGGNSGGTAVNDQGELVGVPTQGGAGSTDRIVDCRRIADTNGDGVIDEQDTCVPMGGFINALRPVNLAKPLIEAARRGLGPQPAPRPSPQPQPQPPAGKATVGRLFFAPEVNDYDQPVTVVDSFPSGTKEIYLFFDYENFQDGAPWQPVLVYEGEVYSDVWPLSNWDGGAKGTWWISIYNEPLEDGTYEFLLYYDRREIASAQVKVGGKAQAVPTFRNLTFSGGGAEGYLLPEGLTEVQAHFEYANMTRQTRWSYIGYYEGEEIARGEGQPFTRPSGTASLPLSDRKGLRAGTYRLELYIGDKLAATADLLIGGTKGGGAAGLFGPITFAQGVDRNDRPVKPGTAFPSGLTELYAFFDYQGMQDGWNWTRRWSIDGEVVVEADDVWEGGESGNWWVGVNSEDGLPDGLYQLELLVEGQLVQSGECTIGEAGHPTPTPTPSRQGVEIYGRITDADTGRGIPGAVFVVLQPGITVAEFQGTMEEVYSYGEADRQGNYQLSEPLVRGESYSLIIWAQGYNPIAEDDVLVPKDMESPYELNITLQRSR